MLRLMEKSSSTDCSGGLEEAEQRSSVCGELLHQMRAAPTGDALVPPPLVASR